MLSRSFNPVVALVVLASLIVGVFAPVNHGSAAPRLDSDSSNAMAQSEVATPPIIQPIEDLSTPEEPAEQVPDGSLDVASSDDLGDGGQPEGLPREITVGDERYLFDRIVPLATDGLALIAENEDLAVYAMSGEGPFDSLYVASTSQGTGELARYLPERLGSPEVSCPAEVAEIGQLSADNAVYIFAGLETDLTEDSLQSVGVSGENQLYADAGAAPPFPELFVADPNGLLRFVIAATDGRPGSLAESLAFNGTRFEFVADVSAEVDLSGLTKVGCTGPYPVLALQDDASGSRYVLAGGALFEFGGDAPAEPVDSTPESPFDITAEDPTEIPIAAPTAVPTEEPTVVPTEVPTEEPTVVPTEVPTEEPTVVPTEVPTEEPTAVPTEVPTEEPTAVPTEVPTEEPTAAPTEVPTEVAATEAPAEASTEEATEAPAEASTEEATEVPAEDATEAPAEATEAPADAAVDIESAEEAGLPTQVEVQNTTYIFNQVAVDIDIQTLVQVEVVTVNDVDLTVYARQDVDGVALELYCVAEGGEVVGRYVPLAATVPTPPAELPANIEVQNTTYIFNEVNVDIDIQTLVEVEVIVVQDIELTIYVDQDVQGLPSRYYAATTDGQIVGQYVEASLVASSAQQAPPPTAQLQPPAFVPTQAPEAPPPPAVTAEAAATCTGDPGEINAQGLPSRLPNRIQLGGIAYAFVGTEAPDASGELTLIGCVSAFEVLSIEGVDQSEVLILRYSGSGPASESVYRFEAAVTFGVEFEITGRAEVISDGERDYRLSQTWQRSLYSSTTVILFTGNPDEASPEMFYAVNVSSTVVGDAIGEYRVAGENDQASDEMIAAAEPAGLNPDLTVEGQRYLLVNVYMPVGTTTNGFVTIFAITVEGDDEILLGRDKRRLELFIYEVIPSEQGG